MELGLEEYWDNFEQSGYTEPRMLEDLKMMNKETLMNDFNITKPAHLDKLYKAIQKVQYPSECKFKQVYVNTRWALLLSCEVTLNHQSQPHPTAFRLYAYTDFLASNSTIRRWKERFKCNINCLRHNDLSKTEMLDRDLVQIRKSLNFTIYHEGYCVRLHSTRTPYTFLCKNRSFFNYISSSLKQISP